MQKSGAQYRQLADNKFKKYKRTLEEEETAIHYYNLAIQSGSLHGVQLSECYRNIGEIYRDRFPKTKTNYNQALENFQKATTIQGLPSWFCVENQTERLAMIPEGAGFDPSWRNAEVGRAMHALALKRQNGGDLAITSQDWLAHGLYHTHIIRADNLKAACDYVDHAIERGWDHLWTSVNYTTYGRIYKYHAERTKENFNSAIEWFQKSIDLNVNAMQSNQPWSIIGRGTARAIFELADLLYEPERFGFSSSLKDKSRGRKLFDQGKEHIAKYGTVGPHSIIESMYVNVFDKALIYSRNIKDFPMIKELCDLGKKISKAPGDSSVFYLYQAVAYHSVGNKSTDNFKTIADNYYHCLMEHKNAKPSEMWKAKHAVKWATPFAMDCLAEGFPAKCKKTKEGQRLVDILKQILGNPNGYNCNHEVTQILEVCVKLYGELDELTKQAESTFSGAYQLLAGGFKSLISKVSNYIGNAVKYFDEPSTLEKVKQKHQEETQNIRQKMEFVRQQTLGAKNTIFKTSKYDSIWSNSLKKKLDAENAKFVEQNKDSSSFTTDAARHGVQLLTKLVESCKDQDNFNLNEVQASLYLSMLFNLGDDYFPTDLDKFLSSIGSDQQIPKSRANLDESMSIDDQEAEFMNFVTPKLNELFNKVNTTKGVSGFENIQEYELTDEVKAFHKTYHHEPAANFEESFVQVGNLYKTCQSRYQDFQNRFENLSGDLRCETSLKSYFRVVQKHRELAYDEDFTFQTDAHNKVWDILRCTYYVELNESSKVQQILSSLEDQGCRVVRMKNKMNTHLQNFTVNFMWGDIICEAQICFGKDTKNSQFVHLIYELQRCKNFCELYLTLLNGEAVVDYCNYLKGKGEGDELIEEVKKANTFIVNISDQLSALEQMFL